MGKKSETAFHPSSVPEKRGTKGHTPSAYAGYEQVIVIGAGASGMMAAIMAARAGAAVLVLEKMKKPGRKLLMTGNGRCNLTHLDPEVERVYHSVTGGTRTALLTEQIFSSFGIPDTLAFFAEIGVMTQDRDGYVYPVSGQAQTVLNALLSEMERLHVKVKYDTDVISAVYDKDEDLWMVHVDGWIYRSKTVILACGSNAGLTDEAGRRAKDKAEDPWRLARTAGHTAAPACPALTAMHCADPDLKMCGGARTRARVRLLSGSIVPYLEKTASGGLFVPEEAGNELMEENPVIGSEEGEIQWTDSEISGIPVFQLSRFAYGLSERNPMVLSVDFLPEYPEEQVHILLKNLIIRYGRIEPLSRLLGGFVHDRIAVYLVRKSGIRDEICKNSVNPSDAEKAASVLAALLKRSAYQTDGVRETQKAQICLGGVSLMEVNPNTLESMIRPGMFLAGEMLDIDGPCGGYNLQWAWSSGAAAGRGAAAAAMDAPE